MGEQFTIATDPARNLIRVTMRGLWDAAAIDAYDLAIKRAGDRMAELGFPRHQISALVDARGLSPQMQEMVGTFKQRFSAPERQPRRLATIVSSALFRRQVERIGLPNQRIFETEEEALRWLAE